MTLQRRGLCDKCLVRRKNKTKTKHFDKEFAMFEINFLLTKNMIKEELFKEKYGNYNLMFLLSALELNVFST
jgi:hypothetical protein